MKVQKTKSLGKASKTPKSPPKGSKALPSESPGSSAAVAKSECGGLPINVLIFGGLFVLCVLAVRQVLLVARRQREAARLAEGRASSVGSPKLRALLEQLSVPAESPFDKVRDLTAGQSLWGVPGRRLEFAAESPLEGVAEVLPNGDQPENVVDDGAQRAAEASDETVAAVETPAPAPAKPAAVPSEHEEEAASSRRDSCMDSHPNADSPDMLHVAYACDPDQMEGLQASVASVIAAALSPELLTVHIMVQQIWASQFKERFGIRQECHGAVTVTGVLVRVHIIEKALIEKSKARISKSALKQRGKIDALENFARFYMHLILEKTVVIYLDADTIVQSDVAQLRKELISSQKTIGFAERTDSSILMDQFLKKPKGCTISIPNYNKIFPKTAYNVGVFAVDLQRWADKRYADRVEDVVRQHNNCGGKLWVGGSQPPLLLAFYGHGKDEADDFTVFSKSWNLCDLGWRTNIKAKQIRTSYVLHWNGAQKPWNHDGLYRDVWTLHRDKFNSLLRPYDTAAGAVEVGDAQEDAHKTETEVAKTDSGGEDEEDSAEEKAAKQKCPTLQLLDDWSEDKVCKIGSTFGCETGSPNMWTKDACTGIFSLSEKVTTCGGEQYSHACNPGKLPKANKKCNLMLLTSYFITKKDWQRGKYVKAKFGKIRTLYRTSLEQGLNVTVIHDGLPHDLIQSYSSKYFHFKQVDLTEYNARYGVNDVRYFFFEKLVRENTEWKYCFIVDAFDVRVGMNPCSGMEKGKLYIGHELDKLKGHPWMQARFSKMGGKYLKWYKEIDKHMKILNCGITGGHRDIFLRLMERMTEVLQDPAIKIMSKTEDINLNMAALNYIVYVDFPGQFTGNKPVHSAYKKYQNERKDVWFVHK